MPLVGTFMSSVKLKCLQALAELELLQGPR